MSLIVFERSIFVMCILSYYRLQGTAIRIEDNVLVTENGCEILNKNCPETIDELCSLQQK